MNYAYARVSSADQNLNRQLDSFAEFGISPKNIYTDKKSGKNFEREGYNALIAKIKKGDLLVIKSIDRLGRNYDMIIEEWTRLTKTIGADIVVLDMPLLDTRCRDDNLTGKLIADIVLQLLSYVAHSERENIRTRQKEGIEAARQRGTRFGRPAVSCPDNFHEVVHAYKLGTITLHEALSNTGMHKTTFYAHMNQTHSINYASASISNSTNDETCE